MRQTLCSILMLLPVGFMALPVSAATLEVSIDDAAGKPVQDAVVSLEPQDRSPPKAAQPTAVMDQHNKEFVPHVLAVEAGTAVSFPNSDDIHHDVYSFSPAKPFELPLYKGVPTKPVIFDKSGVVVLGCNIHDWMLGYIDVVPTPWFVKSDASGQAELAGVPAGKYHLVIWHPDMQAEGNGLSQDLVLDEKQLTQLSFKVTLKAPLHLGSKPVESLQNKFDRFRDAKPPPLSN